MTFGRAFELLSKNWQIIVPGIVIAIVQGVVTGVLKPMLGYSVGTALLAAAVLGAIGIIATILNLAYTTGMAQAAWERGTATYADGAKAFQEDAGNLIVALVALTVLGIIAVVFSIFIIPPLAFWFFFLYTVASAVVGRKPGIASLQESIAIAMKRPVPTLIIMAVQFGLAILVGIIAAIVGGVLGMVPFVGGLIGPIVAAAISQLVNAYLSLVIVGEYIGAQAPVAAA